jgi:glycosyltransferase involved in cell wall biosynthesis
VTASGHSRLLKILHIDPERHWGGGEAQVFGLLTYLAERGHRSDLLTHPEGQLYQKSQALDVKTLPLVLRNDVDVRSAPKLRRLIRHENYDLVHLHTKRAHGFSMWLPHAWPSPKYVVTRRMDYPESDTWYTRYLYNRTVNGVVAISDKIVHLLTDAGVKREKIRLIHSGIDPRPFETPPAAPFSSDSRLVVGTAAVLEERKGHCHLLEAARRLKAQGLRIKYRLAGDGSLRRCLEEKSGQLGLTAEVEFLGFVSDMPSFMAQIDVFVLPSLFEGLGVSVLEAMAAGKPVIASRVGGLPEVVVDTVTGLLVAPRDAEGLAGAITKLAGNRAMARQMGQQGRERLKGNFTLEQMARKNEAYYFDLLAAPGRSIGGME